MENTALFTANNVWMMICTRLVFFMHLGFSFLEIGLTRQKNTVNILFKNFFVITIGLLLYMIGGFNLMYPGFEEGSAGFFKFAGFGIGVAGLFLYRTFYTIGDKLEKYVPHRNFLTRFAYN